MVDNEHIRTNDVKGADTPPAEAGQTPPPDPPAAPETSPAAASPSPPPPSQAVMDIREAGLTPEEAIVASKKAAAEGRTNTDGRHDGAANLAVITRFRWLLIFILSLAAILTWTIESQYSGRPFHWLAWGLLAGAAVLTIPTAKFLRLPTRGGLAALFWSATFFISAFYGPSETIFNNIPAALSWAGLLTLVVFFVAAAIWRKVGRYKVIDLILAVIVIYAALGPLWSLVDNLTAGGALALTFDILSASPSFLTSRLPWFLWPMTVMVLGILPLAALFALWDQMSALRRKGGRHGGNLFLALAFIGLIPYGFLTFNQAVAEKPAWALSLRAIWPGTADYALESPPPPAIDQSTPGEDEQSAPVWPADEAAPQIPSLTEEEPAAPTSASPVLREPSPAEPTPVEPSPAMEPPQASTTLPPASTVPATEEPQAVSPAAPPAPAGPAVQAPSTPPATADERLKAAEERLTEVLNRLEELERKLNTLPQSAPTAPPATPPAPNENEVMPSASGVRLTLTAC